jgi:peptidase-like protein
MSQAVASLFNPDGRPAFEGRLDDVVPATAEQLTRIDALPYGLADMFLHAFEIGRFVAGRSGGAAKRAAILEPTCNVSGLWSGFTAEGLMTITPAVAHARIDNRLVPDQDPDAILARVREHLDVRGFGDVNLRKLNWGTRAYWSPPDSLVARSAARAAGSVWGAPASIMVTDPGAAPMWDVCAGARGATGGFRRRDARQPGPRAGREHPARLRGERRPLDGSLPRRVRRSRSMSHRELLTPREAPKVVSKGHRACSSGTRCAGTRCRFRCRRRTSRGHCRGRRCR